MIKEILTQEYNRWSACTNTFFRLKCCKLFKATDNWIETSQTTVEKPKACNSSFYLILSIIKMPPNMSISSHIESCKHGKTSSKL